MPEIKTKRLLLREITLADAPYILAQVNDPGWLEHIGDRNIHSIEEAKEYIDNKILVTLSKGIGAFFVVIRLNDDSQKIIGQCGIFKREGLEYEDLGFAFLEEFCGLGYGYEAAKAVLDYALNTLELPKLVAITSDDNHVSQALLSKLGMRHTADLFLPNIEGNNRLYE